MKMQHPGKTLVYRLLALMVLIPLAPLAADVSVTTLPQEDSTGTSVTFRGQFTTDEGIEAEWNFIYWPKSDPNLVVNSRFQCCVRDGDIFETRVSGLRPNTGYHWRAQVRWIDSDTGMQQSTTSPRAGFSTPCPEAMCMDFNRTGIVDPFDLIAIIGQLGEPTDPSLAGCEVFDSPLCPDGHSNAFDVSAFQWALGHTTELLNLCGPTLTSADGGLPLSKDPFTANNGDPPTTPSAILPLAEGFDFNALLCVGKTSWNAFAFPQAFASLQSQSLFALAGGAQVSGSSQLTDTYFGREPSVGRLSRGQDGFTYLTAVDKGVYRVGADGTVLPILASGHVYLTEADARYGVPAQVRVGLQRQGTEVYGRPLWDVARDLFGTLYVAPVVVVPLGQAPYLSVAPLWESDTHASGYDLAANASDTYNIDLYDPLDADNPHLTNIREIGLDASLNLFVLNVNQNDHGTILWRHRFGAGLDENCLYLTGPLSPVDVPDPIGLLVSDQHARVFLGSGQADPNDPLATTLFGFASNDLNNVTHQVRIAGMAQVTDITEDPLTGDLWVIGFSRDDTKWLGQEAILQATQSFNLPSLVRIPSQDIASGGILTVAAIPLAGSEVDLPLSVVWTGE